MARSPAGATPLATMSLSTATQRICAIRLALKVSALARSTISSAVFGVPG